MEFHLSFFELWRSRYSDLSAVQMKFKSARDNGDFIFGGREADEPQKVSFNFPYNKKAGGF